MAPKTRPPAAPASNPLAKWCIQARASAATSGMPIQKQEVKPEEVKSENDEPIEPPAKKAATATKSAGAPPPTESPMQDTRDDDVLGTESELMGMDAATWVANFVKFNKKEYNAFYYRITRLPQDKMDAWKAIQKNGSAAEAMEFVEAVKCKKGKQHSEFARTLDRSEFLKTWQTWKEALEKYEEPILLAMVKARTLETRRDPAIPEHLDVSWPRYLQVRMSVESVTKRKDQGYELKEDDQLSDGEFDKKRGDFNEHHPAVKAQTASSSSSKFGEQQVFQQSQDDGAKQMPESVVVALKGARNAHSMCDKFIRELGGAIASSKVWREGAYPNFKCCSI